MVKRKDRKSTVDRKTKTWLDHDVFSGLFRLETIYCLAQGEGVGGWMEWEVGVSRCKLLCIEWINTKVLLCSTEN